MIHHVSLGTNDVARSRRFYDAVLGVLGLSFLKASEDSADYGVSTVLFSLEKPVNGKPASAGTASISLSKPAAEARSTSFTASLCCTAGRTRAHRACGRNTTPTITAPSFDPDGNKIEAVTHHGK